VLCTMELSDLESQSFKEDSRDGNAIGIG
jgi:hypothetical protein